MLAHTQPAQKRTHYARVAVHLLKCMCSYIQHTLVRWSNTHMLYCFIDVCMHMYNHDAPRAGLCMPLGCGMQAKRHTQQFNHG